MDWVMDNVSWVFSGIGIAVFSALGYIVRRFFKNESSGQKQLADHGSVSIQAGRDVQIGKGNKQGLQ